MPFDHGVLLLLHIIGFNSAELNANYFIKVRADHVALILLKEVVRC